MMALRSEDHRRHTRLFAKGGTAHTFFGERSGALPKQADVVDVSESGVRLAFAWLKAEDFPLRSGDRLGFHMKLEGVPEELNVLAEARRVDVVPAEDRAVVGMEFIGLGDGEKQAIRDSLQHLALAKLKSLRPSTGGTGPMPAPAAPAAPATLEPLSPGTAPVPTAGPVGRGEPPLVTASFEGEVPRKGPPKKRGRRKSYIGELLVRKGAISAERLENFLEHEFSGKRKLGEELREKGLVTEKDVAQALAEQARLPYVELGDDFETAKLVGGLPRLIFIERRCAPVRLEEDGHVLVVAMSRPPSIEDVDKLSQATGRRIRMAITTDSNIDQCLKKLYNVRRAASASQARYQARLDVAYRFCNKDWTEYVGGPSCRGFTSDVSRAGIGIVGLLPEGITKERILGEGLTLEVRIHGLDEGEPIRLACRPTRVDAGDRVDIYTFGCEIDGFPSGDETEWNRLVMRASMRGLKPGPDVY